MSYFSRGNFTASDVLTLTGLLTVGALLVSGLSLFSGGLKPTSNNLYDVGTATSSWREVYASSTVHAGGVTSTGNINPFANNTYDLGSPTLSWKDVYASGTLYVPTVSPTNITWTNATGTNTTSTNLAVTNVAQMGTASATTMVAGWGAVGTPAFTFSGDTNTGIYNAADNTMVFTRGGAAGFQVGPALNYSYNSFLPADHNSRDLGSFTAAWKNIYASSTSYLTGLTSAGNITPTAATTYDLGASGNQWSRIYTGDILLQGAIVLNGALITGASTTRALESGFTTPTDGSFVAREFILSGLTADASAQTLSIIESPTSTLKVTNASTNNGLGMLMAGTSTFQGVVDVIRAPGMTTSTLRVGSATLRGCLAIGDDDGAGVTWCTTLNGVMTCSNTASCE